MLYPLDRWLRWSSGLLSATALFTFLCLTLFDAAGRRGLGAPFPGAAELGALLMVLVVFSALPLVSVHGEPITAPPIRLPIWLRPMMDRLVHLASAVTFAALAVLLVHQTPWSMESTPPFQLALPALTRFMAGWLLLTAGVHIVRMFHPPARPLPDAANGPAP